MLEWQAYKCGGGGDDDGQMKREKRNGVVLVGGGGFMPSLTCNAVLGCISQSYPSCQWRGLGKRLTTAKESSRSDREEGRESAWMCGRKSERESQQVCSGSLSSRTQPRCSAWSRDSILFFFLLFLSSVRLSPYHPFFLCCPLFPFCLQRLSSIISDISHQHWLLSPPPLYFLLPFFLSSNPSDFLVVDGVRASFNLHTFFSSSLLYIPWASVHLAGKKCVCVVVCVCARACVCMCVRTGRQAWQP